MGRLAVCIGSVERCSVGVEAPEKIFETTPLQHLNNVGIAYFAAKMKLSNRFIFACFSKHLNHGSNDLLLSSCEYGCHTAQYSL